MDNPNIIKWDEDRKREHDRGYSMPYVNEGSCGARELEMHISVINPGQRAHPPHAHEGEEIMFLLEGTAEAIIGEERYVIGPYTALFCPENVLHGLRNCGDTPIKYLVIRSISKRGLRESSPIG